MYIRSFTAILITKVLVRVVLHYLGWWEKLEFLLEGTGVCDEVLFWDVGLFSFLRH